MIWPEAARAMPSGRVAIRPRRASVKSRRSSNGSTVLIAAFTARVDGSASFGGIFGTAHLPLFDVIMNEAEAWVTLIGDQRQMQKRKARETVCPSYRSSARRENVSEVETFDPVRSIELDR